MVTINPFESSESIDDFTKCVNFNRNELDSIMRIYGRMVSRGEWRDYSISYSFSNAIFSIFRRSSEKPLYMIVKTPKAYKQNRVYSVVAMNGQILKHGKDLIQVLQVLNKKLFKIV